MLKYATHKTVVGWEQLNWEMEICSTFLIHTNIWNIYLLLTTLSKTFLWLLNSLLR